MTKLQNDLTAFWEWAGCDAAAYAKTGLGHEQTDGEEEFDAPMFESMVDLCKKAVDESLLTEDNIDDFLTVMALDNEREELSYYVAAHANVKQRRLVIDRGIAHMQPQARWQIAKILYQTRAKNYLSSLETLMGDSNPYVSKRAKNDLAYIKIDNQNFEKWMKHCVTGRNPKNVIVAHFHISYSQYNGFAVNLIGCPRFSTKDLNWIEESIFSFVDTEFQFSSDKEFADKIFRDILKTYLGKHPESVLHTFLHITVGFQDEKVYIIK